MRMSDFWTPVTRKLPPEPGEYLVTYHPCFHDMIDFDTLLVGLDSFRGKSSWAKKKYQRVLAWTNKPDPYKGDNQ